MNTHVKVLGALFLAFSGFGVLAALILTIGIGVIAGIGLLKFKSWARILGIVLCAICLLVIPFGTIFGIYGLWVLLSKDSERLFQPTQVTTL